MNLDHYDASQSKKEAITDPSDNDAMLTILVLSDGRAYAGARLGTRECARVRGLGVGVGRWAWRWAWAWRVWAWTVSAWWWPWVWELERSKTKNVYMDRHLVQMGHVVKKMVPLGAYVTGGKDPLF